MKVLIACEESQIECIEFRKLGHECFSCDIQDCSGEHPEWHIKDDVRNHLDCDWDLIIAHPPCTYLCIGSAVRLYPNGLLDHNRYLKGLAAKDFFRLFLFNKCKHIAIENPVPLSVFHLPCPDQIIQPYMFGDPYSKKTCLWLKGLPQLLPNVFFENDFEPWVYARATYHRNAHSAKDRSKSFPGIARAMARQWSDYILNTM